MSNSGTSGFARMMCPNCGTVFKISVDLYELRLKDGKAFYCPNGHGASYDISGEPNTKQLKARNEYLEKENKRLNAKLDLLQDQLAAHQNAK